MLVSTFNYHVIVILILLNLACGSLFVVECLDEFCLDPIYNTIDGSCNEEVFTGKFSNQVIGSDGLPFFSYCEIGGPYDNIKVAHCGDLYCSNPNNITINTIGHSFSGYTTIAIGNDGFPRVAYYNTYSRQLEVINYYSYNNSILFIINISLSDCIMW